MAAAPARSAPIHVISSSQFDTCHIQLLCLQFLPSPVPLLQPGLHVAYKNNARMLLGLDLTYFADESPLSDQTSRLDTSLESGALDIFALGGDIVYPSTVMLLTYGEYFYSFALTMCYTQYTG